ncbi:DM13 domain-containing protein [Candidatus Gracilibacteria bacterium]|nr:DM13 domain-containing protein [Thermales bacterium]NJL96235.1 DM13 domain-containing protein [Candidatus Gracilibacteria bacterium]
MKKYQKFILGGLIVLVLVTLSAIVYTFLQQNNQKRVEDSMAEVAALPDRSIDVNTFDKDSNTSKEMIIEEPNDRISNGSQNLPTLPNKMEPESQPVVQILKSGNFESVKNYQTSGGVGLEQNGDNFSINLAEDFSFSGAPDPVMYLCNEANPRSVDDCLILGALQNNSGEQAWEISETEANQYNNVILWCRAFNVLMGTSSLK